LEILTMARDVNSTNLFVYNLIGVANANLGRLDDAIENWSRIIEAGQDDEYLHLNLARAYFESQRYREALEEYELILDMFPAGHDLHKLAEQNIEMLREKVTEKTVVINTIKDISPYFVKKFGIALPNIDEELSKKINFNKLADYIVMLDITSYKIKSIIFDKIKEDDQVIYDEAEQTFTINREAYKTTIKLRKSLKKIKTMVPLKDKNEAEPIKSNEEEAKEKEQIKIRQIQTQNEASRISTEEIQSALDQAQALVASEPNNEWAHYSLGSILAQIGSFKEASESFSTASTINPNNAIAWYALGLCHVRMNQLDDAIQALQQAIISVPDSRLTSVYEEWNYKDSLAYFGLGDVYIRKGMFDEAIKIFQKGLMIDATSALAHFQLGTCFEVKEQYDEAIESLLNSLSLNPNFSYAYSKLGIIYFRKELYTEAQVMLLKAVGYENPDSESYFFLGEVYLKLGKPEDTKYCYTNIIQSAPKDDMYYEKARKKLEELGNK
nr:tetratricopeptide repeat protein [Candidatus Wallbacteria bacterium]